MVGVQTIPATVSEDLRIDRVFIGAASLRALTDADGSKTTAQNVALEWTATKTPMPFVFMQASPGVYSQVKLRIDRLSGSEAFQIEGKVRVDGDLRDFEIECDDALDITVVDIDTMLAPGREVTITIGVDFAAMVANVNWANAEIKDGELTIDDDNAEMMGIRTAMRAAFAKR